MLSHVLAKVGLVELVMEDGVYQVVITHMFPELMWIRTCNDVIMVKEGISGRH